MCSKKGDTSPILRGQRGGHGDELVDAQPSKTLWGKHMSTSIWQLKKHTHMESALLSAFTTSMAVHSEGIVFLSTSVSSMQSQQRP